MEQATDHHLKILATRRNYLLKKIDEQKKLKHPADYEKAEVSALNRILTEVRYYRLQVVNILGKDEKIEPFIPNPSPGSNQETLLHLPGVPDPIPLVTYELGKFRKTKDNELRVFLHKSDTKCYVELQLWHRPKNQKHWNKSEQIRMSLKEFNDLADAIQKTQDKLFNK